MCVVSDAGRRGSVSSASKREVEWSGKEEERGESGGVDGCDSGGSEGGADKAV